MITTRNHIKYGFLILILLGMTLIYRIYDPSVAGFFPGCPFHSFTGLLCPGCGSQRAIHHLLHFRIANAFAMNPLLVISIPYIVAGLIIDRIPNPSSQMMKWRQIFFGRKAIFLILLIIISFWIIRNL